MFLFGVGHRAMLLVHRAMLLGVAAPGGSTDTVVLGALKGEDLFLFG